MQAFPGLFEAQLPTKDKPPCKRNRSMSLQLWRT